MKSRILALAAGCIVAACLPLTALAAFRLPNLSLARTIGARDYQSALTTTPYKAFSSGGGSSLRSAADIGTAVSNTTDTWVVLLPAGSTAPASLAAIQADPTSFDLKPGDRLIGSTDTGYGSDIWIVQASGTGAVSVAEKSSAAPYLTVLRYAQATSGGGGGGGAVTVSSSVLPTNAASETGGNLAALSTKLATFGIQGTGQLKINGSVTFGSSSSGEATNAATTTPATMTLDSGSTISNPLFILITNAGSNDAYVSPVSGGHTLLVPAGQTVYCPFVGMTLYDMSTTGTTTLYCIKAGF